MNDIFAKNLKKLRKKYGYSQEDLSELIGYSSKNISKWETCQTIPNVEVLKDICSIFQLESIDRLLTDDIDYYEKDIMDDIDYLNSNNIHMNYENIKFYYQLLKNRGFVKIPTNDETLNHLANLSKLNILQSYTVNEYEKYMFIRYSLVNIESDDKTLRSILQKIKSQDINFTSDKDYNEFIQLQKFPKQVLVVLDYIDHYLDECFLLTDLYNEKLLSTLKDEYKNNKDYKKIVRTCLSRIVEVGIVLKTGRAMYKKRHHKIINEFELNENTKKRLNIIMGLEFSNYFYERDYAFDVFNDISKSPEELSVILNNYMVNLRNLSLITDYELKIEKNSVLLKYYIG